MMGWVKSLAIRKLREIQAGLPESLKPPKIINIVPATGIEIPFEYALKQALTKYFPLEIRVNKESIDAVVIGTNERIYILKMTTIGTPKDRILIRSYCPCQATKSLHNLLTRGHCFHVWTVYYHVTGRLYEYIKNLPSKNRRRILQSISNQIDRKIALIQQRGIKIFQMTPEAIEKIEEAYMDANFDNLVKQLHNLRLKIEPIFSFGLEEVEANE